MGAVSFPGEGVGDDGRWPPESSLLILEIAEAEAGRLDEEPRRPPLAFRRCCVLCCHT